MTLTPGTKIIILKDRPWHTDFKKGDITEIIKRKTSFNLNEYYVKPLYGNGNLIEDDCNEINWILQYPTHFQVCNTQNKEEIELYQIKQNWS